MALTTEMRIDREILDTLVLRVRVLSVAQIARAWWADVQNGMAAAQRRLDAMEGRELIRFATLSAKPELPLSTPLAVWLKGIPPPDLGAVAFRLRDRWKKAGAARPTACILATAGVGRQPRVTETTHDLHLAAVYLLMLRDCPTRARTWKFETELARPDQKLPDAIVTDGRAKTAIELGGQYDRKKLEEFHADCQERGYGYEIW